MSASLNLDWLISVDDHILEPPHLWVDRVAAKDQERAPHMELGDRAGILASMCFPTVTRFCGQLFMDASDRELGFVCLQFTPAEPPVMTAAAS